jgi:RNA polymerase sigma factor for flagellar operon FliA
MKHAKLSPEECEALIERYAPLVRSIAQSMVRKLPPSVELDELMQDGYLGLLGALLQATRSLGEGQFRSYLAQRVRGAIVDGLRQYDPGSRRLRREMRRVEQAIHRLTYELDRPPLEGEVATALGLPLPDYQILLQEASDYALLSLEDFAGDEDRDDYADWCTATGSDPMVALQRRQLQRALLLSISHLNTQEAEVLRAYYVDELTMREIGKRLGLSEGRISQVHTQAIARLRAEVFAGEEKPGLLKPRKRVRDA